MPVALSGESVEQFLRCTGKTIHFMKTRIIYFYLICLSGTIFSQQGIAGNSVVLKKGIYMNIDQFKTNNPTYTGKFKVKKHMEPYGLIGLKHDTLYCLKMKKKRARMLGPVYGFSDGQHVYINYKKELLNKKTVFCELDYVGRYCCMHWVVIQQINNPMKMFQVPIVSDIHQKPVLAEVIMDINTGDTYWLNNSKVEEIIRADEELYNKYLNDASRDKNLKRYIIEYSEKHVNEIRK